MKARDNLTPSKSTRILFIKIPFLFISSPFVIHQQVVENSTAPPREDRQRDKELLEDQSAKASQAAPVRRQQQEV